MAYVDGDWRMQVRGTLNSGEVWFNTWTFRDIDNDAERLDVVAALHQFYEDITSELSNDWASVGCTSRNLFTSVLVEESWAGIVGAVATDMLPGQLAVRLSLQSALGQNGGPFLVGFHVNDVENNGQVASSTASNIRDAASDFGDAVVAAGAHWCIDRPTVPETVTVQRLRVGQRFDVIRKRANDVAESYLLVEGPW